MNSCDWCGKIVGCEPIHVKDALGDEYKVCNSCKEKLDECRCRKCGNITDPSMMIKGLCTICIQAELSAKSKRKEEVIMGVDMNMANEMVAEIQLSNKEYESWMMLGNAFSPKDAANSKELRRLWIMVKLNSAGIHTGDEISKYIDDMEVLLDRNFSKLVGNKCRIIVGNSPDSRKLVRESNVLDYENEVYVVLI